MLENIRLLNSCSAIKKKKVKVKARQILARIKKEGFVLVTKILNI